MEIVSYSLHGNGKGAAGGDQTGPPQTAVASLSSGEERGPMARTI